MSTEIEDPLGPWKSSVPGGVGTLVSWTATDGTTLLASSGTDGVIRIWDPAAGVEVGQPLVGHTAQVWALAVWAWSGGTMLVSTGEDKTIRRWDVATGMEIGQPIQAHQGWVRAIAMWDGVAGAPRLASAGSDGAVCIWDPVRGTKLGAPLLTGVSGLAALASWSGPGGTRLAVACDDGSVSVWDPGARVPQTEQPFERTSGLWTMIAWTTSDGDPRLASAGHDGTVRVWNPEAATPVIRQLRGHTGWVATLGTWRHRDGGTGLVSASTDGTIRMWDPETGALTDAPLTVASGSFATLTTWTSAEGGRLIAFVGDGGTIRVYDADSSTVVCEPMVGHTAGMWALTSWMEEDGARLAASGDDGVIRIWNADSGLSVGEPLVGHTAGVWALVAWCAPDGRRILASTGDDGTIRRWDLDAGAAYGMPLTGHAGWVPALTTWHRGGGDIGLASGGFDGTVRRWDSVSGRPIGEPRDGHAGWVMAVTTWRADDANMMATGGFDQTVRRWNADTGEPVGAPLTGHTNWVRALVTWTGGDGRTVLISGSFDGTIRRWDAERGTALGEPIYDHSGWVASLTTWTATDGTGRLASAGIDGVVRLWHLDTGELVRAGLCGHRGGVWALTSWRDGQGRVRVASAGHDGTVRLWDPDTGQPIRSLEVGPVAMWGVSDAPTKHDTIGRQPLANAIADQLRRPSNDGGDEHSGPTVVSIEGPWGCGKSSLMNLIRQRLPAPRPAVGRGSATKPLTVRDIVRQINRYEDSPEPQLPAVPPREVVTAWFNPWGHQSGEQVWAGLASAIIDAAAVVLYPSDRDREHYWFARNLRRIDRQALRQALRRRTVSPILGLAIAAVVAPIAIAISDLNDPLQVFGRTATPAAVGMGIAVASLLAGVVHTLFRRRWGRAMHYLPTELFQGPVVDGASVGGGDDQADLTADPLRRARAGSLYLYQHNIGDIVDDLATHGCELVVFVDDIDRCRAETTAEVFEAINLFLANVASRTGLRARFVVGLDSSVVAAHLDALYSRHVGIGGTPHGDDPSNGWAFLRKLIQLPVAVPQVPDDGVERFVDAVTRHQAAGSVRSPDVAPQTAAPHQVAPRLPAQRRGTPSIPGHPGVGSFVDSSSFSNPAAAAAPGPPPVQTVTWRSLERHPQVRELVVRRLWAQPDRSIREGKRLLNVWQLYVRLLDVTEPITEPAAAIARARSLLLMAEIVTRWPALQRVLNRSVGDQRGLQLLAAAAPDDSAWEAALAPLGLSATDSALVNLRALLRVPDAVAVADLARRLM